MNRYHIWRLHPREVHVPYIGVVDALSERHAVIKARDRWGPGTYKATISGAPKRW